MIGKEEVAAALRADEVASHFGIKGQWRGRWMRASRCARTDHSSDAFGLARDGMWHCWACDEGGDLLKLVATGEGLDVRADFPRVLSIAAKIAGVEESDDFGGGRPQPKPRPPLPPELPFAERLARARRRARFVWSRLQSDAERTPGLRGCANMYLEQRGLDAANVRRREELRDTPLRCTPDEWQRSDDLQRMARLFATPGLAVPVRAVADGSLVDVRIRRVEPREGQPKIVGMLGNVTVEPEGNGKLRQLVGCYGRPHAIDADLAVVVEGLMDYLTALALWPDAAVLGAVDAGSLSLVAEVVACALASRDATSRILIVEQNDGWMAAADRSVNEDANAASKIAIRILGPQRVGWLFCDGTCGDRKATGPGDLNDLNDLVRAGVRIAPRWWADLGEAVS